MRALDKFVYHHSESTLSKENWEGKESITIRVIQSEPKNTSSYFSGGPVISRNWDRDDGADVFTLVGVVSGNPATCIRNTLLFPDLYTFVGESKVVQFYFLLVLAGAIIVKSMSKFRF